MSMSIRKSSAIYDATRYLPQQLKELQVPIEEVKIALTLGARSDGRVVPSLLPLLRDLTV